MVYKRLRKCALINNAMFQSFGEPLHILVHKSPQSKDIKVPNMALKATEKPRALSFVIP